MSSDYIWPLSKNPILNEMNTSFGPRINTNRWDFHDGSDLPAEKGTKIYAMRDGTVLFAGAKDKDGYSSRHIVLEVDDPNDGLMYLVHLHLDSIDGLLPPARRWCRVRRSVRSGMMGQHTRIYTSSFFKARPIQRRKPVVTHCAIFRIPTRRTSPRR